MRKKHLHCNSSYRIDGHFQHIITRDMKFPSSRPKTYLLSRLAPSSWVLLVLRDTRRAPILSPPVEYHCRVYAGRNIDHRTVEPLEWEPL